MEGLKKLACTTIDNRKSDLNEISQKIWRNPELSGEEFAAHDLLTSFLEKEEFKVSKKTPLETSFIARYGNPGGLKIGVLCEYDALPGIGHACGHNLIAEAGIGAALGIKSAIDSLSNINTELIVFGTPAEESYGGKAAMIEVGVFDETDFCMMSHPTPVELPNPNWLSAYYIKIVFSGKSSHAAAAPWEGINALDAAVACYNYVAMLRQQIKPTSRISIRVVKAGDAINVIPETSEVEIDIRSSEDADMCVLKEKIVNCVNGAALSTGCTVEIEYPEYTFLSLKTNKVLCDLYVSNAKGLGIEFNDEHLRDVMMASTDMGNVSKIKPSIHPLFKIKADSANHTHGFTEATGADENQLPTLNSAKSMAMTAIDVICKPELLKEIRADFAK